MKKEGVLFRLSRNKGLIFLCLFLVLSLSLIIAQEETEKGKIDKAYQCLTDKVSGRCLSLSSEEKAFSALAIGECSSDLTEESKFKTDIKYTAQAILALDGNTAGEDWLISLNSTPTELTWFLEIESSGVSSCSIEYLDQSFTVNIDEDKKLSKNAGSCLVLAQDNYWLRVSPSCYNTEFSISCNQNFLTTLLFKKATSSTIHVSEKTSSAAAEGTTTEEVKSFCLAQGTSCNYEANLWAALALDSQGRDVSSYLPYLIILADEHRNLLPEAFLYALTANTEFKVSLLSKQKSNKWWLESLDKFYDTALALYPLQSESPQEKTNAKTWLLNSQDNNGCWEDNTRNTAFILASIWPRQFDRGGNETPVCGNDRCETGENSLNCPDDCTGGGDGDGDGDFEELPDCRDVGYYCTTTSACEGEFLSDFYCPSLYRCCTTPVAIETCSQMGGDICSSNQRCIGGTVLDSSNTRTGEICCVGGSCASEQEETSECELNNGICVIGECSGNEKEEFYSCNSIGETCCVQQIEGRSYLWIWILLALIILVVLGIIFRDKLRKIWSKMRSRGKPKPGPPHFPSYSSGHPRLIRRRVPERRILLPTPHTPQSSLRKPMTMVKSGSQKELDDVLKKLKDMSK